MHFSKISDIAERLRSSAIGVKHILGIDLPIDFGNGQGLLEDLQEILLDYQVRLGPGVPAGVDIDNRRLSKTRSTINAVKLW